MNDFSILKISLGIIFIMGCIVSLYGSFGVDKITMLDVPIPQSPLLEDQYCMDTVPKPFYEYTMEELDSLSVKMEGYNETIADYKNTIFIHTMLDIFISIIAIVLFLLTLLGIHIYIDNYRKKLKL